MSNAHYCVGCGRRWLTRHEPSCAFARSEWVRERDCYLFNPPPWPADARARTAPHGEALR